jgi:putative DNA primase/helicase
LTDAAATPPDMTAAALALHNAGLSVIPASIDGTKAPLGAWKKYQHERMPVDQLRGWFDSGHPGIGIVTGAISGGLELLELEGRAVGAGILGDLVQLAQAAGLGDLLQRLLTGYLERSPSGGLHFLYRLDGEPVPGNLKLARDAHRQVLIETRGEGGFVVVAPSHGSTHETGRPWQILAGGPATIPTITADERDAFHSLCKTFDHTPASTTSSATFAQPTSSTADGALSPGDDYEARTDWQDILGPEGWTLVTARGQVRYWRRPGKRLGISATTGAADDRDRLYVFTTSTIFDSETPYTKFGAYALIAHGGDHHAAAKQLHRDGYGRPAPEPPRPAPAPAFAQPGQSTPAANARVDEPQTYTLTDDGNALRLVDTYANQIRYCPERSTWLTWRGHRWAWDTAGTVHEHARGIARGLPEAYQDQRRHRRSSLSARGLAAMAHVGRTDPRIVAPIDHLDARPFELNTPTGIVDLRTGAIRSPDPTALHSRSTTVAPDPDRPAERWLQFLATTFAGDPALTLYVQRLLGVSLVGQVVEQLLPFAHGEGANGKTTLLGAVMRIIGLGDDGYALSAPAELLLATSATGHPTEIARLAGARLVVTSELDDGQKFAEARIKQLTGRDPIAARFMRGDFFTFQPTHSLWLLGNHQPSVRVGGPAFWRRIRLLPFLHVVPPEERDPELEDKLVNEEGPAILAWLIQGAVDYFRDGLAEPESVRAATSEYEGQQDTISRFVEEMCETGSAALQHMAVGVPAFRAAYETWCRQEGEQPASARALTQALQKRFDVVSERSMSTRFYRGIRLLQVSSDEAEEGPRW